MTKVQRFVHFDNAIYEAISELLAYIPTDITPTDVDEFLEHVDLGKLIKEQIDSNDKGGIDYGNRNEGEI